MVNDCRPFDVTQGAMGSATLVQHFDSQDLVDFFELLHAIETYHGKHSLL